MDTFHGFFDRMKAITMYDYDANYKPLTYRELIEPRVEVAVAEEPREIPAAFQYQVWRILKRVVGTTRGGQITVAVDGSTYLPNRIWRSLYETLGQEIGLVPFRPTDRVDYESVLQDHLIRPRFTVTEFLNNLDVLLHTLKRLQRVLTSNDYRSRIGDQIGLEQATDELNRRLQQSDIPYEIDPETCLIMRVDSNLVHSEVLRPTLTLLRRSGFQGAESEFLAALDHHRNSRHGDAITAANAAFESVLKQICDERSIKRSGSETGGSLLRRIINTEVLPRELGGAPEAIERMYGTTLSSVRDQRSSAHGAGSAPREVEHHLAAFAIHLSAAFILLIVESHIANPVQRE